MFTFKIHKLRCSWNLPEAWMHIKVCDYGQDCLIFWLKSWIDLVVSSAILFNNWCLPWFCMFDMIVNYDSNSCILCLDGKVKRKYNIYKAWPCHIPADVRILEWEAMRVFVESVLRFGMSEAKTVLWYFSNAVECPKNLFSSKGLPASRPSSWAPRRSNWSIFVATI